MKTIDFIKKLIFFIGIVIIASCEDYLEKTPAAEISDEDVFSTFLSFQGFLDPNYFELIQYNAHYPTTLMDIGGESHCYTGWSIVRHSNNGNYWYVAGSNPIATVSHFNNRSRGHGILSSDGSGIWRGGWRGIRRCNMALEYFDLLTEATDEEKNLLLGQIYFWRAYFHNAIIEAYGGMPYVEEVLSQSEPNHLPRQTYHETVEKIITDFDKAILLLPVKWDETAWGAQRPGANEGRATKGVAMAFKQKALLYAGSPLMNKFSGNDYTYNVEYCKRAAAASWELIQLANTGMYSLVPWENYSDNFFKTNNTMPWTSETIFQKINRNTGRTNFTSFQNRQYVFPRLGGWYTHAVNQKFVDKFEMADGTRYKEEYDSDNAKRWDFRDPRFRKNLIVDRDRHGFNEATVHNLYTGTGSDKTPVNSTPLAYMIKKFTPAGANEIDRMYTGWRYITPLMRLAQVYLDYAEAVTAAYGPNGSAPGASLTAVDAVNIVRARAGMPPVTSAATGYDSFMDLLRNERNVELCFEGQYWYDIRRWHIGHLPENRVIEDLEFDKDWTPESFKRVLFMNRVFEDPKHYWLPLPKTLVEQYKEMTQNPGWE